MNRLLRARDYAVTFLIVAGFLLAALVLGRWLP